MTLVDQTVLRGRDGRRWVVQTLSLGAGFRTTARLTGCDLTPAGTHECTTLDDARRVHARYCAKITTRGTID